MAACSSCWGSGGKTSTCDQCQGSGKNYIVDTFFNADTGRYEEKLTPVTCAKCRGSGQLEIRCSRCGGSGREPGQA